MEAAELTATRTRVVRVMPPVARVLGAVSDLRATQSETSELVDQLHHGEWVRILGQRVGWSFVQAEDHYFGWVRDRELEALPATPHGRVVATLLAPVHDDPDARSPVVGHLAAGTILPSRQSPCVDGPWLGVHGWLGEGQQRKVTGSRVYAGYVSLDDVATTDGFPYRVPSAADLLKTSEAFLGVPYLWGGTTALGIDCSGFVQQVYRLNGIRLDRDAHQQAMEGRSVDVPAAGDLIFFGADRVTHVGLAVNEHTFINAPQAGTKVRYDELPAGRNVLAIRRYLP